MSLNSILYIVFIADLAIGLGFLFASKKGEQARHKQFRLLGTILLIWGVIGTVAVPFIAPFFD